MSEGVRRLNRRAGASRLLVAVSTGDVRDDWRDSLTQDHRLDVEEDFQIVLCMR